jgi:hypothetical protein
MNLLQNRANEAAAGLGIVQDNELIGNDHRLSNFKKSAAVIAATEW